MAVFAQRAVAGLIFLLLLSARDFDFQKARRPDLIIRTIEQNEWSNADHRPRHNDDRPGTQSSNQSHSPPVRFNQGRSNMVSGSARLGGPRISNAGPAGAEHDWFKKFLIVVKADDGSDCSICDVNRLHVASFHDLGWIRIPSRLAWPRSDLSRRRPSDRVAASQLHNRCWHWGGD